MDRKMKEMERTAAEVIRKIYTVNLGVKKDENVLVFTDHIRGEEVSDRERERREFLREIARAVAETGKEYCSTEYLEYPSVGGHGKEPPVEVWTAAFGEKAVKELTRAGVLDKILSKTASPGEYEKGEGIIKEYAVSPDAVIALSNYSTSHTRFRDLLTRCRGARYASMPLFDREMLTGVMTADWDAVSRRTMNLVKKMNGAETAVITSHNGTSIMFSIKGRNVKPDTGILTIPGSFGNLPAGEAFLAPVEGTADGVLILEWAPTRRLRNSVELTVKNGLVVDVYGKEELADALREKIEEDHLFGNIAELGIGTNDKATRPDNILETEKILGTIHIALGDNSSFGGKVSVPFHQDFIFFKPTMEVLKGDERIEILIDGEPRF